MYSHRTFYEFWNGLCLPLLLKLKYLFLKTLHDILLVFLSTIEVVLKNVYLYIWSNRGKLPELYNNWVTNGSTVRVTFFFWKSLMLQKKFILKLYFVSMRLVCFSNTVYYMQNLLKALYNGLQKFIECKVERQKTLFCH